MLIYLDTRDLIGLLERGQPLSDEEFGRELSEGNHMLAVSFANVRELVQPFFHENARTVVTNTLNRLERLPLTYIREAYIDVQELQEAHAALEKAREYIDINPFVRRFDEACTPLGQTPATAKFILLSLVETVFLLLTNEPDALRQTRGHADALRALVGADRGLPTEPQLRSHFRDVVARHNARSRLGVREDQTTPLAEWIYDDPSRCPAMRLGYEIYHALRNNSADRPQDGDVLDIAHAKVIPYVDLSTLDARMRDYVSRVTRRTKPGIADKVCKNLDELLTRIREAR